jgi:hypothetical protein
MKATTLLATAGALALVGMAQADLLITEVVDGTLPGGLPKWVELTNTGSSAVDLTLYSFGNFNNGSTTLGGGAAATLIGTLPAGASYVINYDADNGSGVGTFYDVYGQDPDFYMGGAYVNGDDVLALFLGNATGDGSNATMVDVYGMLGTDGSGTTWETTDSFSYRCGNSANNGTFDENDWHIEGLNGLEAGCNGDDLCEEQNLLNWTTPWIHVGCGGEPGVGYCFGDGSGTACPCANNNDGSLPGAGCDNGVFASGGKITGSGIASLASDTLVLIGEHLEPNNSGLYFQADNDLSPGNIWGDGLQCAGGQLKRLGVRFSDANGDSDTSGWATTISAKAGNITAGDTKRYQIWYRTNVAPPCGAGINDFNATNGYAITWLP